MHGRHNFDIVNNVAFEVFGHCYFTEDGIETGNTFQHNLGGNILKPLIKVIDGDSDNEPYISWITISIPH